APSAASDARRRSAGDGTSLVIMWQLDSKMGSGSVGQQVDAPAVRLHVFADDRQADAGAAHGILRLDLAAEEGLEGPRPVARRGAGALVADPDARDARLGGERDGDAAARRTEAYRIGQQVAQGRGNLVGVDGERGQFPLDIDVDLQVPRLPLQALLLDQV